MKNMAKFAGIAALVMTASVFAQTDEAAQDNTEATSEVTIEEQVSTMEGKLNGLEESYLETKTTVDKLKKIKVSGYIHAEMQIKTQDPDNKGKWSEYNTNLQIRRSSFKLEYAGSLANVVFSFNPIGGTDPFEVKDVYVNFKDQWTKMNWIQAGYQDVPFGFENGYSSGTRETPERSKIVTTAFPSEKDMGVYYMLKGHDGSKKVFQIMNLVVGVNNGSASGKLAKELDNAKSAVGRLRFNVPANAINMNFSGGGSGYYGNNIHATPTDSISKANKSTALYTFNTNTNSWVEDKSAYTNKPLERYYAGGDLQITASLPIGGLKVMGEYIQGAQPSVSKSTTVQTSGASTGTQMRNISGWYAMYVQTFGKKIQSVVKYDFFDPNTDIAGDDITYSLGTVELAQKNLGIGANYFVNDNIKLSLYWDHMMNETSKNVSIDPAGKKNLAYDYSKDVKDNHDKVTIRVQGRF